MNKNNISIVLVGGRGGKYPFYSLPTRPIRRSVSYFYSKKKVLKKLTVHTSNRMNKTERKKMEQQIRYLIHDTREETELGRQQAKLYAIPFVYKGGYAMIFEVHVSEDYGMNYHIKKKRCYYDHGYMDHSVLLQVVNTCYGKDLCLLVYKIFRATFAHSQEFREYFPGYHKRLKSIEEKGNSSV